MELYIKSVSDRPYRIAAPDALSTPCLLLFLDRFEFNMKKMKHLLASTARGFDLMSLWPHVKTHKSVWVTKQMMQAGIKSFKTTPNEVDMLREAGAKTIFIAYPLVQREASRVARLAGENSERQFIVQASHPAHVECLLSAAKEYDIQWQYFLDLDVGMHRTGALPGSAFDLFKSAERSGHFKFVGFHAYDGHNASPEVEERRKTSKASIEPLIALFGKFERERIRVPKLVMGGTPSFLTDLAYLAPFNLDTEVILSPGTWIFFDTMYTAILPGTFDVAACILAQVMDRPQGATATLNLGYKRWSIDQGPIEGFSVDGMQALGWSEEHTVVSVPEGQELHVGDYVLVAPRHVCSTINLWEHFSIVGADGEMVLPDCPVDARNR